jgi:hypothetical protein
VGLHLGQLRLERHRHADRGSDRRNREHALRRHG